MDTKEFRELIAKAKGSEWFNSVEIKLHTVNSSPTIKGFSAIHNFFTKQIEGWKDYGERIPQELKESKNIFTNLKRRLEDFVRGSSEIPSESLNNVWLREERNFNSYSSALTYDSSEAKFLLDLHRNFPESFKGAFNFIQGSHEISNKNNFIGAMLAYEFFMKDRSDIVVRRKKEKSSFSKTRNDLIKQMSELEAQISEHLKSTNQQYEQHVESLVTLTNEKKDLFNNWFVESKKSFIEFSSNSAKNIEELKNTYEVLLKLKAPAEHWNTRAKELKKEGRAFIWGLAGMVVVVAFSLYWGSVR